MNLVMRKPVFAQCEQQRRRSGRFSRDETYAKCGRDLLNALSGVDYGIHALVSVIIQPSYP